MANSTIKLLTNQAAFPLLYSEVSRATTENQDASPRMPYTFYGDRANADFGQPQIIYCENALPYARGMYTVGYAEQVPAISPATEACDIAIILRDAEENNYVFSPAAGANYVFDPAAGTWASVDPFVFTERLVTYAYVDGRTFVCYEKTKIIEYVAGAMVEPTITYPPGVTIADVRGIIGASNYLLFFTDFAVYWCAPLNIFEFADIDQGAGSQTPTDIEGLITCGRPISGGFIIYTVKNAIGAKFTNNAAAPFIFRGINNAGGTASQDTVTDGAEQAFHYLWGTKGLQKVTFEGAAAYLPEVTDFLVGKVLERWNTTTKEVEIAAQPTVFSVKIAFLAGRYLAISYGGGTIDFEFALMVDTSLERWGKLRIEHIDAFTYPYVSRADVYDYDELPGFYEDLPGDYASLGTNYLTVSAAKRGIAFLARDGSINVLLTDFGQTEAEGCIIFGHLQQRHDRLITVTDVIVDGLKDAPTPQVTLLGSEDGSPRNSTTAMDLQESAVRYNRYVSRHTALNFDIAIEGTLVLSSCLAQVIKHGYR